MELEEIESRQRAALDHLKNHRGTEMLESLRPLLEWEHPPSTALVLSAMALQKTEYDDDDIKQAETNLRKAMSLDPLSADARLELGHLLLTHNESAPPEVDDLLAFARRLIRRLDIDAVLLEARLLEDRDHDQEALKVVDAALERLPDAKQLREERHLIAIGLGLEKPT